MDLYHLKTFFVPAKEKNFTRAAQLLFVTQSAVSHAVKKLETSLDTPLFNRQGKTMDLTRIKPGEFGVGQPPDQSSSLWS